MTQDERDDLIDLYIDDTLPSTLRANVEAYLTTYPEAAADAATLQIAVTRLKSAPNDRPDSWFVERALDRLLREHAQAQETEQDSRTPFSTATFSRRK